MADGETRLLDDEGQKEAQEALDMAELKRLLQVRSEEAAALAARVLHVEELLQRIAPPPLKAFAEASGRLSPSGRLTPAESERTTDLNGFDRVCVDQQGVDEEISDARWEALHSMIEEDRDSRETIRAALSGFPALAAKALSSHDAAGTVPADRVIESLHHGVLEAFKMVAHQLRGEFKNELKGLEERTERRLADALRSTRARNSSPQGVRRQISHACMVPVKGAVAAAPVVKAEVEGHVQRARSVGDSLSAGFHAAPCQELAAGEPARGKPVVPAISGLRRSTARSPSAEAPLSSPRGIIVTPRGQSPVATTPRHSHYLAPTVSPPVPHAPSAVGQARVHSATGQPCSTSALLRQQSPLGWQGRSMVMPQALLSSSPQPVSRASLPARVDKAAMHVVAEYWARGGAAAPYGMKGPPGQHLQQTRSSALLGARASVHACPGGPPRGAAA